MASISCRLGRAGKFFTRCAPTMDAQIAGGPGILSAQGKEQIDLRAPGANAGQRGQRGAHRFIIADAELVEVQPLLHKGRCQRPAVTALLAA